MFVLKRTMYRSRRLHILSILLLALCFTFALTSAQTSSQHDLTWKTFDNGHTVVRGGRYTLSGTVGQPEAGTLITGGNYQLQGGFWNPYVVPTPIPNLYLPIITQ